jgi:hypothetical protein
MRVPGGGGIKAAFGCCKSLVGWAAAGEIEAAYHHQKQARGEQDQFDALNAQIFPQMFRAQAPTMRKAINQIKASRAKRAPTAISAALSAQTTPGCLFTS